MLHFYYLLTKLLPYLLGTYFELFESVGITSALNDCSHNLKCDINTSNTCFNLHVPKRQYSLNQKKFEFEELSYILPFLIIGYNFFFLHYICLKIAYSALLFKKFFVERVAIILIFKNAWKFYLFQAKINNSCIIFSNYGSKTIITQTISKKYFCTSALSL